MKKIFVLLFVGVSIIVCQAVFAANLDVDLDSNDILDVAYGGTNVATATANHGFMGPAAGAAAAPAFRALVALDIPDISASYLATAGTDNVKDTHIDWGSGAGQVDIDDIADSATYQRISAADVDASSHVNLIQDVDGTGAFTFTGSTDTRAITVPVDGAFTIVDLTTSQTLTTKIIDADDNTLQDMPWALNISMIPNDSYDNLMVAKLAYATAVSSIGCIVDPADAAETVLVDIYECDSNGDNCAAIVDQITCANTPTAANVTDAALAAGGFLKVTIGTVTGTVSSLLIYGAGKQTW